MLVSSPGGCSAAFRLPALLPSPKGRPGGPRAERSDGIIGFHFLTAPSMNTSTGVLLSRALCLLSLL